MFSKRVVGCEILYKNVTQHNSDTGPINNICNIVLVSASGIDTTFACPSTLSLLCSGFDRSYMSDSGYLLLFQFQSCYQQSKSFLFLCFYFGKFKLLYYFGHRSNALVVSYANSYWTLSILMFNLSLLAW